MSDFIGKVFISKPIDGIYENIAILIFGENNNFFKILVLCSPTRSFDFARKGEIKNWSSRTISKYFREL